MSVLNMPNNAFSVKSKIAADAYSDPKVSLAA